MADDMHERLAYSIDSNCATSVIWHGRQQCGYHSIVKADKHHFGVIIAYFKVQGSD
jgi:hypothetical protein